MIDSVANMAVRNAGPTGTTSNFAGAKSARAPRRRRSACAQQSASVLAKAVGGGEAWEDVGPVHVAHATPAPAIPLVTDFAATAVSRKETVLVVDSVPLMRGTIAQVLRKLGYRVLEASGALGVQRVAVAEKDIRLLVLDLSSVEISDLEFIAWFRMSHPTIKVVVAAGSLWELNFYHGIAREITLLAKPFTPTELARIVRRVLA